jgi:hypothetical protein
MSESTPTDVFDDGDRALAWSMEWGHSFSGGECGSAEALGDGPHQPSLERGMHRIFHEVRGMRPSSCAMMETAILSARPYGDSRGLARSRRVGVA